MAQSSENFANVEEGSNNLHYHSLLFPSRSRRINNKYILECEDPSETMLPAVAAPPSVWWKSCTEVHNISFIIFLWWVSLEMKEGIKVRNWCVRYVCLASLGFKLDFKHIYIDQNLISVYRKWWDHSRQSCTLAKHTSTFIYKTWCSELKEQNHFGTTSTYPACAS